MIYTLIAVVLGASLMTCMEVMMQIRKIQPVTGPSHTLLKPSTKKNILGEKWLVDCPCYYFEPAMD